MLVNFFVNLKEGYKPAMSDQEEKEVEFYVEAPNMATAVRMVKQLLKADNVDSYDCVCIDEVGR